MALQIAGNHEPTEAEALATLADWPGSATVTSLAASLGAWNRKQHVAAVVANLVAEGLVERCDNGWCITPEGEARARSRVNRFFRRGGTRPMTSSRISARAG